MKQLPYGYTALLVCHHIPYNGPSSNHWQADVFDPQKKKVAFVFGTTEGEVLSLAEREARLLWGQRFLDKYSLGKSGVAKLSRKVSAV